MFYQLNQALFEKLSYIMPQWSQRDVLAYIYFPWPVLGYDDLILDYPSHLSTNIELLAKAAAGLFIWASTAVKLVSLHIDNPFQKLKDIVSDVHSFSWFGLDDLYANVLRSFGISWGSEVSRTRFSQVLALITLSKVPLSIDSLDAIMGFPPEKSSRLVLSRLQCLLAYSSDVPDAPI